MNGLGYVTGLFQTGYALGQAIAPIVSVMLYQITPWLPWATLAAFAVICLAVHKAVGLPWFSDVVTRRRLVSWFMVKEQEYKAEVAEPQVEIVEAAQA